MRITDDKIRDEKLQCNINREAVVISALSSRKTDKCQYLTDEDILLSNQRQIIEKAKFAYFPLGKAFEKQTEKQVGTIKSIDLSNKLKRIEGIFQQNLMNDLIRANLKEIVELQGIIKKDDLNYKPKKGKTYFALTFVFLGDINEGHLLSIKKTNNKESNIANALKDFDKGIKTLQTKKIFFK